MSYPKWITPAGQLGIVPELDYYEFPLDAYDSAGGTLVYSLVSGRLPLGLQIIPTGKIQGIPISQDGPDKNVSYSFTVRVKNSSTGGLADRTFSIIITNVAPPIITPKNVDLGTYLDGTVINLQLEAIEFSPSRTLTWTLTQGKLPPGLSLNSNGLLSGYIQPIPETGPGGTPGWDISPWDYDSDLTDNSTLDLTPGLGWEFTIRNTSKRFNFTIEVFDGTSYDASTYSIFVIPRNSLSADTISITADSTQLNAGDRLTVDTPNRHDPIIITTQDNLPEIRQSSYFSFNVDAIDLDGDTLVYTIPAVAAGTFDEQDFTTVASLDYVAAKPISNILYAGAYPRVSLTFTTAELTLYSGNIITANTGDFVTQPLSGANARIVANVVNSGFLTLEMLAGNFVATRGNIAINGNALVSASFNTATSTWSNVGIVPATVNSGEPTLSLDFTRQNLYDNDTIKVIGTDNLWREATVNSTAVVRLSGNTKVVANVGDYVTQAVSGVNAEVLSSSVTVGYIYLTGNIVTANTGTFISQTSTGANATVISNVAGSNRLPVQYNSGNFSTTGNISINGTPFDASPSQIICETDLVVDYQNSNTFLLRSTLGSAYAVINSANTASYPSSILGVGVGVGSLATEGTVGFDEGKFDQGQLAIPPGLVINQDTGWITGTLPSQSVAEVQYNFEVSVYKQDYPTYRASRLYTITVLGDLFNRIDWITPADLGTIENGRVSDLYIQAVSTKGKPLYYSYTPNGSYRLPQGLQLTSSGLISGRVSFEVFSLDARRTTLDNGTTTFDNTYSFDVTAKDIDGTIDNTRTFTIRVVERNITPYEDLYLEALPSLEQRTWFNNIIQNRDIFPTELIYRNDDPWFGLAKRIRTLFLPGLAPSTLAEYALAASTNHFTKRINFTNIKTAQVLDSNFNVKYEVVYVEVDDENTNVAGFGPQDTIDLTNIIANPYLDNGESYTVAYPNAFTNMRDVVVNALGYANKGALPDWMTSRQEDGRVLGFTRAVVLAYTVPGASKLIAYRLSQAGYNLNTVDFRVDRYHLDNNYSANFEIPQNVIEFNDLISVNVGDILSQTISNTEAIVVEKAVDAYLVTVQYINGEFITYNPANLSIVHDSTSNLIINGSDANTYPVSTSLDPTVGAFIQSSETTFDRYPPLGGTFNPLVSVDYASTISFEDINNRSIFSIRSLGGIDGVQNLRDGDTLIFAEQEFRRGQSDISDYNQGWSRVLTLWDGVDRWDWDANTAVTSDDLGWDSADYVPGYNENLLDPAVTNERIGVWRVNINVNRIVTLTFLQTVEYYDVVYVRTGSTYGGTNVYYDPVIKAGNSLPNYSIIPQEIRIVATTFDGNGTRFFDFRDSYSVPREGDKYIKFAKLGVFN